MPLTHTKVSLKSDGGDATLVRPTDWNANHTGSCEWDSVIVKSGDQGVTNSTTLFDDTELQVAVLAGEVWRFEVVLVYSGTNATADYKWAFAISGGNLTGWHRITASDTTADGIQASSGVRVSGVAATTAISLGTDASGTKRMGFIEAMYRFSANGTFKYQFAQNTLTASVAATTRAGTILRAQRITA